MRKIITAALTAAATVPLLLVGATAASASAAYDQHSASASADGACASGVDSFAGHGWDHGYWDHGYWGHEGWVGHHWGYEGPSYLKTEEHADAHGASSALKATGVDAYGHVYYLDSAEQADGNGASSNSTGAHS
jgi:hypothetical protein